MILADTSQMKKTEECVSLAEYDILNDKYNRLLDQFNDVMKHNQELEEKLLAFVDKSEYDKLRLSHEIDDLSERLQLATYSMSSLQSDCARYKADCVLAVHLLQCQPSQYISQKLGSATQTVALSLVNNGAATAEPTQPQQKRAVHVSSFPPMAIVFDQDVIVNTDSTAAVPLTYEPELSSFCTQDESTLTPAGDQKNDSLRDLFLEKMTKEPVFTGTVQIHQCLNCGRSRQLEDKQTQTSLVGDLICFTPEESDQLCTQPCVHSMKRMRIKGKRCDSTDSVGSNDTEY